RRFKVQLPERLIGEADHPRDLVKAILAARPAVLEPARVRGPLGLSLATVEEPIEARTLIEALAMHAERHADRDHVLLWRLDSGPEAVTYRELYGEARAAAGGLIERGIRSGDRIALMLPTSRDFFVAFFAILFAGAIPVPIYPPFRLSQIEDHLRRQARILGNAEACVLVTSAEIRVVGRLLYGLVGSLQHIVTIQDLAAAEPLPAPLPATANTMALIQYTSGSTGDPKGVVLTHGNLLANIRAMGAALKASSADRVVSWLPLYHDMGLIGCWLGSLYYGAPALIMSPLSFLADPARWLWAIGEHKATISAAPNFAYEFCLKSISDARIAGLDLSSLRAILNGAEPVSPISISRFAERFAPYGFQPRMMTPVYGLAENAVGLAFPPLGRGPLIDRVDRSALDRDGVARITAAEGADVVSLVACGRPLPRHEIRVVDDASRELPERQEGRIQFRGPSATRGYYRNPEKTRALFDGDWLETGDRGYIAGGDVFITGRIKDLIKRAGRNIYPQELEETVGSLKGARKGCVAVFPTLDARAGTERLIVMAETRLADEARREALRKSIVEASQALLDLAPDAVVLVPPRAVPKTSSGQEREPALAALARRTRWHRAAVASHAVQNYDIGLRRLRLGCARPDRGLHMAVRDIGAEAGVASSRHRRGRPPVFSHDWMPTDGRARSALAAGQRHHRRQSFELPRQRGAGRNLPGRNLLHCERGACASDGRRPLLAPAGRDFRAPFGPGRRRRRRRGGAKIGACRRSAGLVS
ncbi:MAG: AMP-dependent synthetase and, partial [Methylocystaceae bacterium]